MSPIKLVVFDLDKTLWDHPNVSSLKLPLKRVTENTVEDSEGSKVTLYDGIRETLKGLKDRGIILSIASWNYFSPTSELLKAFDIEGFFEHPQIEWYRPKSEMIETIIEQVHKDTNVEITWEGVLFVDDYDNHLNDVMMASKKIRIAKAWVNPKSPKRLLSPEWLS